MTYETSSEYEIWFDEAKRLLPETSTIFSNLVGSAADLIGHQLVTTAAWDYYEQARRIACPWLFKKGATGRSSPFREAEAIYEQRALVREVLGEQYPLEMVFGIAAIATLGEAGLHCRAFADDPPEPPHFLQPGQVAAYRGIAEASALISFGRQLQKLPAREDTGDGLEEVRRRLNRYAAEERNAIYRQLRIEFLRYLSNNEIKSIRNAAKVFYEGLPSERQIYQSVDHAVRNLSESLYGRKGKQ